MREVLHSFQLQGEGLLTPSIIDTDSLRKRAPFLLSPRSVPPSLLVASKPGPAVQLLVY